MQQAEELSNLIEKVDKDKVSSINIYMKNEEASNPSPVERNVLNTYLQLLSSTEKSSTEKSSTESSTK